MPLIPTSFSKLQIDEMMLIADYGLPTKTILGPTRGGAKLNVEPTYRGIVYDGAPSDDVLGNVVLDNVAVTLEFNTLDWTQANINKLFGVLESNSSILTVLPRGIVPSAKYLTNVVAIAKLVDGNYKKITLLNVLGKSPLGLTGAPKAEGEVAVILTAHYDPANPGTSPISIEDVASATDVTEYDDYAGELTVTSIAGTTTNDTKLSVAEPSGYGKAFWYKLQANDTPPVLGSTISTLYTLLPQGADIAASTSTHVSVVEKGLDNIVTRFGVVALVKHA